jgi:hypothetical protein
MHYGTLTQCNPPHPPCRHSSEIANSPLLARCRYLLSESGDEALDLFGFISSYPLFLCIDLLQFAGLFVPRGGSALFLAFGWHSGLLSWLGNAAAYANAFPFMDSARASWIGFGAAMGAVALLFACVAGVARLVVASAAKDNSGRYSRDAACDCLANID